MAFDPDAYLSGGTAVAEPFNPDSYLSGAGAFDPDAYLRKPGDAENAAAQEQQDIEASMSTGGAPAPVRHAVEGVADVAKGFVPTTPMAVAELVNPVLTVPHAAKQAWDTAQAIYGGAPITEALKKNYPEADLMSRAEKTAPYSRERFQAAATILAELGMAAGGLKQGLELRAPAHPELSKPIPGGGEPPNAISQETITGTQIAGTETAARYQGPAAEAVAAEPAAGASIPQQQPAGLAPAGDASYAAQQGGSPIPEGAQSPPGEAAASQSSLTPQGPLTFSPFADLPAVVRPDVPAAGELEALSYRSNQLEQLARNTQSPEDLANVLKAAQGLPFEERLANAVAHNPFSDAATFELAISNERNRAMAPDSYFESLRQRRDQIRKQQGLDLPSAAPPPDTALSQPPPAEVGLGAGAATTPNGATDIISPAGELPKAGSGKLKAESGKLYHGTSDPVPFSRQHSEGYWLSDKPEAAAAFGENVSAHTVEIGRQANLNDPQVLKSLVNAIRRDPPDIQFTREELLASPDEGLQDWFWQNAILKEARKQGYDSATFLDSTAIEGPNAKPHQATIVFDRNRIKSAAPHPGFLASESTPPRPRSFRPDGGFSEDPLVAFVQDQGGILSKSAARQKWGTEKYAINASLWEDAPAFPDPRHNKVYNTKSGQPPDAIAQAAADAGLLPPGADATTLWNALGKTADSAHRTAKAERAQAASIATQAKQTRAFTAAAAKPSPGDKPISAFELSVGDTVKVGTETLKVRSVDPETYAVELEDGSKFGIQHVEDGTVFFGEHEAAIPEGQEWKASQSEYLNSRAPATEADANVHRAIYKKAVTAAVKQGDLSLAEGLDKLGHSEAGKVALEGAARFRAADLRELGFTTEAEYRAWKAGQADPFAARPDLTPAAAAVNTEAQRSGGLPSRAQADRAGVSPAEQTPLREFSGDITAPAVPTLRPGENQGDLLSTQTEDLSLVGEKGIDYAARAAEELRKTQAAEAAAAIAKKQQPNLFGPSVLEKLGLTREDLGAIGAVPHGTAQTALLIDRTRNMVRDIADVVGGKAAPKLTRAGVLDEATQHAAARQYVPALIEDLQAKVFPDKYKDHAAMERTIDIIKKDNILGGYDDAVRELLRLNGTAGPTSAEAQAQAAFVKDIATAQNIPQLDAEVRASLNTDIAQDVQRWETHVSSLMDNLYNELKLANPGTPRETRGRHYAARMNLLPLHEEARISSFSDQNQPLPEIATSNYRNPNMKHDKFMRKAALTGEYSSDPTAVLLNSLGGRINEVTKLRFYQALERTGVGMIEDSFDPSITEIGGKPAARMPIKYPETDPKTGRTRMVEKSLYVQKELVPEIRGILNTDGRVTTNPVLAFITKVQMLQLADASSHIKNIHSVIVNSLGSTAAGRDLLRKVPMLGSLDAVAEINSVARAVSADTPGMRSEIAFLARNGMIRPEYPSTDIQRITRMQDLIHTVDTASRVIMNRRFDQLVRRGWATDTLENRRNFVQQIGEYNRRLMSKKEVMLRDYGASPFIVAGRTFNRFARRLVTGNPGFEATNTRAAVAARAAQVSGLVFAVTLPAIVNSFTTGSMGGRPGTPVGAIDFGPSFDTKDGKRRMLDILHLTGMRRGLRQLGIDAAVEGFREGQTLNEIMGNMGRDIITTALHPYIGPGLGATYQTITGKRIDLRAGHVTVAESRNVGGGKQYVENLRVALKQANPFIYGVLQGGIEAGMQNLDIPPEPGGARPLQQTLEGAFKAPLGAIGYKEPKNPTAMDDTFKYANDFREKLAQTDPKIRAEIDRARNEVYVASDYKPLQEMLRADDKKAAVEEIQRVMREKGKTPSDMVKYFANLPTKPVTGSQLVEAQMLRQMPPADRSRYELARKERMTAAERFFPLLRTALQRK